MVRASARSCIFSGRVVAVFLRLAAISVAALGGGALAETPPAGSPAPYRIECPAEPSGAADVCRTDLATYVGRRVFGEHCASCHGADALGSSFAPALTERVRRLDESAFHDVLEHGYRGEAADLPRWGDIPDVRRYADALWAYVLARANGDLPPGPIDLLPGAGAP